MEVSEINDEITNILNIVSNVLKKHNLSELENDIITNIKEKLYKELPELKKNSKIDSKKGSGKDGSGKDKKKKTNKDDSQNEDECSVKTNFESKDEIEKLKLPEIKETLKIFGLKVGGKKEDLVNRMWVHISSNKEFLPFFTTNDNNRIKYGGLNNEWSHKIKYCGVDLFENYYKHLLKLKKNENDIEKNLFYNKDDNNFISFFESSEESDSENNYISIFSLTKNGKSKNFNINIIETKDKNNIEEIFENINVYELIH